MRAWLDRIAVGPEFVCGLHSRESHAKVSCFGPGLARLGLPTSRTFAESGTAIASGGHGVCALLASGTVSCLGPAAGEPLSGLSFQAIAVGDRAVCGILGTGEIRCFGDTRLSAPPTGRFTSIAVGGTSASPFACALDDTGVARCFGPAVDAGEIPALRE